MALWVRAASLATVAVLVGCAGTASSRPRVARATTTSATSVTPKAVPLVLETAVPGRPPAVELIAGAANRELGQRGVLFTSDWTTRHVTVAAPKSYFPVRWPSALPIADVDAATLAIHSPVLPDWVVVKTYTSVTSESRTPDARPINEIECTRFTTPKCDVVTTDAGLRIPGLGRRVFAGPYVVVFCIWHVPLADQRAGSLTPGEVVASWLFHFEVNGEGEGSRG